jgi:hypothetical protein
MKAVLPGGVAMAMAAVATLIVSDESETGAPSKP